MSAPTDGALRKRILLSIGLFGAALCGGIGVGGWRAFERWYDFRPAAAELPAAERAYRAAGMPWEAWDLAPRPPVAPGENGAAAMREAAAWFSPWNGGPRVAPKGTAAHPRQSESAVTTSPTAAPTRFGTLTAAAPSAGTPPPRRPRASSRARRRSGARRR